MSPTNTEKAVESARESPGFPPEERLTGAQEKGAPECPIPPRWMSDELVSYTQEVWGRFLGRSVPRGEAIEMLADLKRIAEAFRRAAAGMGGKTL
ncbi:MAG: hypothetical protein AAB215_02850 [Planctomycetota bacterium]